MQDQLFLDTEWANDASRELVSLALVSADGTRRFYAERDPLPGAPSSFVRKVVYPLLERGPTALIDEVFGTSLRDFITGFDNPVVLFDAPLDRMQILRALSWARPQKSPIPSFEALLVTQASVLERLERYFEMRPDAAARRHHAGIDAEALRQAFLGAGG